jgi:phosphinothricin acetyltransferase
LTNCAGTGHRVRHALDWSAVASGKASVRAAVEDDLESLSAIYNRYVLETHYTFDLEPMTSEARREWFTHYDTVGRYRLMVAVIDGAVAGFASSGRWRPRAAYETSIETSVYLTPDAVGHGTGTRLYEALFHGLESEDVHRAYAGIALPNPASVALHERFGFKRVAHFTEQGRKFGKFWDVAWFEKPLAGGPPSPTGSPPPSHRT